MRSPAVVLAAVWLAAPSPARAGEQADPSRAVDVGGVGVALELLPARPRQGDDVAVTLRLQDAASGRPLSGARPGAWLARRTGARPPTPRECTAKAAAFLGSSVLDRPAADLNGYYVLVLNEDASIFVVDPRFSFGGSRLLAMLPLPARGADWAVTADGSRLFVSVPEAGKLAAADLLTWSVRASVEVGPEPGVVALEPGGERIWVATRAGVAAVDARSLERTRQVPLPGGAHALAIDRDGRHVFATVAGGVAVLDPRAPERRRVVALAGDATTLAFSEAAGFAYAGDPGSGDVFAVDPERDRAAARFTAEPGFTQIRFAPGGRLGFLPNPVRDVVQVFDAATNRIVRTIDVGDGPDQVTFTDNLAYVRRRGSEIVIAIPLAGIEREGEPTGIADFPGGQHALGAAPAALADSIVAAPEGPAVLVANPLDRTVYYYKEGMAAPMGGFANFSRQPRAVKVVDRSLREQPDGRYGTTTRLGAGVFDLVVFLDAPRAVACFEVTVDARPGATPAAARTRVELVGAPPLRAGAPARLRVRLTDAATGLPLTRLPDVEALVVRAPGVWQRRAGLVEIADGVYEMELTPPEAGAFSMWVESDTAGLTLPGSPSLLLAVAGDAR
jgi:DNA-binding beta-propeller fold protein YncE